MEYNLLRKNIKIVWNNEEYASIRHPQSIKTERINRNIGDYLRVMLYNRKHTKWKDCIEKVQFLINNLSSRYKSGPSRSP